MPTKKDILGRAYHEREEKKKQFGDKLRLMFKASWVFNKWYEKLIIAFSFWYTIYTLIMYFIK